MTPTQETAMVADQEMLKSIAPNEKSLRDILEVDLHGWHPDDIDLAKIIEQSWELGATCIRLIHGHGRNRGISPGFVNTNTGYFGLRIRAELRSEQELRRWIKHTTLDCSHEGSTCVKLKSNPKPTRNNLEHRLFLRTAIDEDDS